MSGRESRIKDPLDALEIYLSYIMKAMSDSNLFKDYTMQELLDELDVIERFEQPGSQSRVGEMTNKQMNLYTLLGVAVSS